MLTFSYVSVILVMWLKKLEKYLTFSYGCIIINSRNIKTTTESSVFDIYFDITITRVFTLYPQNLEHVVCVSCGMQWPLTLCYGRMLICLLAG